MLHPDACFLRLLRYHFLHNTMILKNFVSFKFFVFLWQAFVDQFCDNIGTPCSNSLTSSPTIAFHGAGATGTENANLSSGNFVLNCKLEDFHIGNALIIPIACAVGGFLLIILILLLCLCKRKRDRRTKKRVVYPQTILIDNAPAATLPSSQAQTALEIPVTSFDTFTATANSAVVEAASGESSVQISRTPRQVAALDLNYNISADQSGIP